MSDLKQRLRTMFFMISLLLSMTTTIGFTPQIQNQERTSKLYHSKEQQDDTMVSSIPINSALSGTTDSTATAARNQILNDFQRKGVSIASSFVPQEYTPHFLFRNKHVQTILGVFLRDELAYIPDQSYGEVLPVLQSVFTKFIVPQLFDKNDSNEDECDFWDERERVETPDGDFFDVDYKYVVGQPAKATAIIIHGLESNSNSSLCLHMARAYMEEGSMNVACINFRGCSGEPNQTMKQYHAGFTDDVKFFLEQYVARQNSELPLYLTGFSLGANVVMKTLGELGLEAVEKYNIRGAAVSGAPFSLNFHWRQLIDDDFNRLVYAGSLLKSMKKKAQYLLDTYLNGDTTTDLINYDLAMNATTIPEVEDAMVAPLFGFRDKFDYYDKTAALNDMDQIAVPTYILNAADDPFFKFGEETKTQLNWKGAPLTFVQTEYGGHLGHLCQMVNEEEHQRPVSSFAPMELARFLNHVQQQQ